MLDLDKEIVVTSKGKTLFKGHAKRTIAILAKTLAERGDPQDVYSSEIKVELGTTKK